MRYCVWHKFANKIAVGLTGKPLQDLTKSDADMFFNMIHTDVRSSVEIRPMGESVKLNLN